MTYRFVGSHCELGNGAVLDRFGASIDLSEAEASEYVCARAALLPDAEFQALGFTEGELDIYFAIPLQGDAPAEFVAKRDAAWAALRAYRDSLIAAEAAKE